MNKAFDALGDLLRFLQRFVLKEVAFSVEGPTTAMELKGSIKVTKNGMIHISAHPNRWSKTKPITKAVVPCSAKCPAVLQHESTPLSVQLRPKEAGSQECNVYVYNNASEATLDIALYNNVQRLVNSQSDDHSSSQSGDHSSSQSNDNSSSQSGDHSSNQSGDHSSSDSSTVNVLELSNTRRLLVDGNSRKKATLIKFQCDVTHLEEPMVFGFKVAVNLKNLPALASQLFKSVFKPIADKVVASVKLKIKEAFGAIAELEEMERQHEMRATELEEEEKKSLAEELRLIAEADLESFKQEHNEL